LLRLAIAEARRFPDLGSIVIRVTRERGAEIMMRLLGEAAESGEVGTFPGIQPDRLPVTARYFIDLILLPQLLRALSGEQLKTLQAEIGPHVSQRVAFLSSRMPEWRHQVIGFGSGERLEVQATVTAPARNLDGSIQRLAPD